MKLDKYIASEKETAKSDLSRAKAHKKLAGKDAAMSLKRQLDDEIYKANRKLEQIKSLKKYKPVRLLTGAVIPFTFVEAIKKKLKGVHSVAYIQHPDGLSIVWGTKKGTGKMKLQQIFFDIPDDVELPEFEEGEVVGKCLN